jgi:hypothetical protein
VAALIYADRIRKRRPSFVLTETNIHRFFITVAIVVSKFFSDECYTNAYLAQVGGVPVAELNSLELTLLIWVDFDIMITLDQVCLGWRGEPALVSAKVWR